MSDDGVSREQADRFVDRHIGPGPIEEQRMLDVLGFKTISELMAKALPGGLVESRALHLPSPVSEVEVLRDLRRLADLNVAIEPMLGLGYNGTVTPAVIRRNLIENPAWYTAYTPYQPEISQGRLEALLNFQTMIADLTALPLANASLLDEATAAAEAVALMHRVSKVNSNTLLLDEDCHPQTLAVVETRCRPVGIEVVRWREGQPLPDVPAFGALLQYPGSSGVVREMGAVCDELKEVGTMVAVVTDPLALMLLTPPGSWGADIAVGSTQRFGVPIGFGGPHAAFMSVRQTLERSLPGRLVGVSIDAEGRMAYRLALQTREQHIRREKATSNICTAQSLLAMVASMYAIYHGDDGLRHIAKHAHRMACTIGRSLAYAGYTLKSENMFDTVTVSTPGRAQAFQNDAITAGVLIRVVDDDTVSISTSETTTDEHVGAILRVFDAWECPDDGSVGIPTALRREGRVLTHSVFSRYHSETAMMRYLRRLADKDLALDRGMIPLGSCTMKLNAAAEMESLALDGFANAHPFAPARLVRGSLRLIAELEDWLAEITGYSKVSVQPNAGSQGELAGLLAIRAYHASRGEAERDVCLIPASAHGTNAASAVIAGMRVVVVKSQTDGSIDMHDFRRLCEQHSQVLAAAMVTYPSTNGVYEDTIRTLCDLVHLNGGQMYIDGANLNALVGVASPGLFGGDVSHLNLHKTFCIPHGGGGPGVGPVAVAGHLVPFLPSHPLHPDPKLRSGVGPVAAAPFGSAWILGIAWAYIRMMSGGGLRRATLTAVLSANYVARRLSGHYELLFAADDGLVAHECIIDLRPLTKQSGVTVDDVAKRLVDYGFHAPTVSFPVAGTLMIEPTESEDLSELDRFCDAMIAIRVEIESVACGEVSIDDSALRNSPHTALALTETWTRAYSREFAVFPTGSVEDKYWPPVGRIDQSYGDRNLVCTCPPIDSYFEQDHPE